MSKKGLKMSAAEEHLLCERIEKLKAKVKSQSEHIGLLQQCDDTSTDTIAKMDKEIEQLDEEMEYLKIIIKDYYAHCGNNKQICGLNHRAEQALKD